MSYFSENKDQFIRQYVSAFLGSHAAVNYDSNCSRGWVGKPYEHQPVEDAVMMAKEAWESIQKEGL